MEPGSGGSRVGEAIAERLGFDFFHRKLLEAISASAQVQTATLDRLEKERFSGVQDFIASLLDTQYLPPTYYAEYLLKVVNAIGRRGRSVIVGRGANFILPPVYRYALRVVAPFEQRVRNVAEFYGISDEEAGKRIVNREERRAAFVRKTFGKDIADPVHYDLTLNTARVSIEDAAETAIFMWKKVKDEG
jgi:hypothetical protein